MLSNSLDGCLKTLIMKKNVAFVSTEAKLHSQHVIYKFLLLLLNGHSFITMFLFALCIKYIFLKLPGLISKHFHVTFNLECFILCM